jgi:hypothetical protein
MKKTIPHFRLLFFGITTVLVLLLGVQTYMLYDKVKSDDKAGLELAETEMDRAQAEFTNRLNELTEITEALATQITNEELDSLGIMNALESAMKANKDVFGFGVGYEPNTFSDNRRLFGPFFIRPDDKIQLQLIEDSYDYSTKGWYTRPLHNGAAWFEPPYFGQVAQTMMAEYSVPFYGKDSLGNKVPIGIVFLDYSLHDVTKAVNALDLGKSGYGFIFSEGGVMVAHPIAENIQSKKTLDEFVKEWDNENIKTLFNDLNIGGKPYVDIINPENEAKCRMFFKEIEGSNWRLGAVFLEDAFKTNSEYLHKAMIRIIVLVVLLLLSLITWRMYLHDFNGHFFVKALPFIIVVLIFAIVAVWSARTSQAYNVFQQDNSYPITDETGLHKFLSDQDSLTKYYHEPEVIKIPTGVFIKHIEFDGSHNIRLSGMVWQKYDSTTLAKGIDPGVFFMTTAPDAEVLDITETYRKQVKDQLVIGWHFRVEVREQMFYGLYPLDRERISLKIEHPDMSKNIQLIPDLESYETIIATGLPGLDKDVVLPEWNSEQTYYDFQKHTYNTNFGVLSELDNDYKYDLGFNVVLKRKFLWPFMGNIIPLSTICVLLFLSLVSISKNQTVNKGIVFSGFGLLELCAAFLFVAILTHIDLRSDLVVNYIIYMDYFYFHVYFAIILCAIAAVLYNSAAYKKRMYYVMLIYWPAILGSLFVSTVFVFY